MYSTTIICTMLFVVFTIATTNASLCRPVTCMIACPYGFASDENGCPHCSCRVTPNICVEPIMGYNCGTVDHRDCPSSHECHLTFSNLHGQCCLKTSSSTTGRPATGGSTPVPTTSRPVTGTNTFVPTTSRPVTGTNTPVPTTPRPVTGTNSPQFGTVTKTSFATTIVPQTSTVRPSGLLFALSSGSATTNRGTTGSPSGSPASTTQRTFTTTGRGTGSPVTTSRWF